MSELPPGSRPTGDRPDADDDPARKFRVWAGIGLPTVVAGLVAGLLGIPWWIVGLFCLVIALLIINDT
jgi:hypothetical protein